MGSGRYNFGGLGTQTAGLGFGGYPSGSGTNATEEYNGSTWTAGGNLNTGRQGGIGGAGIQTAGLAFGGAVAPSTQTEEYDGSSWTNGGNLSTGRGAPGGAGLQTAALAFGGLQR
jgi:hypothetical protein